MSGVNRIATINEQLVSNTNPLPVEIGDSGNIDAFARIRVSNPLTLFDSKNIFKDPDLLDSEENQPLFYDNQEVSGSGTSTLYEVNKAQQVLRVGNLVAGKRLRQTKMRFNYQPGKSMLILMTFAMSQTAMGITKEEGYGDNNNGVFFRNTPQGNEFVLRSNATGTPVETIIKQDDWNLNTYEDLDVTKTQILIIDMEWLGVGRVRIGFVKGGVLLYCHQFIHDNTLEVVYMSLPNLPLRSHISNDGTGEEAFLTQICSTVISEGGQDKLGKINTFSTNALVGANVTNTIYALLGFRLKENYKGLAVDILSSAVQISGANKFVEWGIYLNPTVAGTFTYEDIPLSGIQVARGATANTVTGGSRIAGGYVESGGNAAGSNGSIVSEIQNAIRLGESIAGVRDYFVLTVKPIFDTIEVNCNGLITIRELN